MCFQCLLGVGRLDIEAKLVMLEVFGPPWLQVGIWGPTWLQIGILGGNLAIKLGS